MHRVMVRMYVYCVNVPFVLLVDWSSMGWSCSLPKTTMESISLWGSLPMVSQSSRAELSSLPSYGKKTDFHTTLYNMQGLKAECSICVCTINFHKL